MTIDESGGGEYSIKEYHCHWLSKVVEFPVTPNTTNTGIWAVKKKII